MNTQITFTVQGHLTPYTEVMKTEAHPTHEQALKHIQALVDKHQLMFRGKRAKAKIVSLITK